MKIFFDILGNSFSNPRFYQQIQNYRFKHSLLFFVLALSVLSFFKTGLFMSRDYRQLEPFFQNVISEVEINYPPNLEINWNGSELALINSNEEIDEFLILYPTSLSQEIIKEMDLPNNLLIYKNSPEFSSDEIENLSKNNLLILNKHKLYFNSNNKELSEFSYRDIINSGESIIISNENLSDNLNILKENFYLIDNAIKKIIWIVMPLIMFLISSFTILLISLMVHFLARLRPKMAYRNTVQISLHLAIVAETINQMIAFLYGKNFNLFGISFWILYFYIYLNNRLKKD